MESRLLAKPAGDRGSAPGDRHHSSYLLVLLAILGFWFVSAYLLNQAEVVSQEVQLSYLKENVGQELKPEQALSQLREGKFTKVPGLSGQLDLGYLREGVWVLMEFSNPEKSNSSAFVLQLRHTYINGSITELKQISSLSGAADFSLLERRSFSDKLLPKSQNLNDVRHVSFPVNVEPGQTYRALVRLKAHVMNVPFLLLDERVFLSSVIRELVPLASLFGGLILLALYNFMVGLARNEPEFLFYSLYVAAIALMSASINGTGHMFLWTDKLWFHYNSANILINIVSLSYMGFAYFLFRKTKFSSLENVIWLTFLCLGVFGFVLQLVEGGFFASIQANVAALAALTLGLSRAWRARVDYGRIANLFIFSELVLFSGAFAYCIKMFGWLPSTTFTLNIVLLSATLEAILLSFVLSEKMRRTMGEKDEALRQLESAHSQIEQTVRDRTLALAARYTSHEVLNPVFAIRLKTERICEEVDRELQKPQPNLLNISGNVLQKSNDIFNLLDSIIHTIRTIKTMSVDGQRENVVSVDLQIAFDGAAKMLEAKLSQLNCELTADFSAAQWVEARNPDVVHVIANLISNALDAVTGQEKSWIRVTSCRVEEISGIEKLGSCVEISVCDSGPGPSQEIQGKLFKDTITTKGGELGMGVGLSFCTRLVPRNRGFIDFDSKSKVTRFFFVLPAAQREGIEEIEVLKKAS